MMWKATHVSAAYFVDWKEGAQLFASPFHAMEVQLHGAVAKLS
jgi:hypothetical protein